MIVYSIQKTHTGYAFIISEDKEQPTGSTLAQGEIHHPAMIDMALNYFALMLQMDIEHLGFDFPPEDTMEVR